ncbi:hypothetical protein HYPSUDRAFT_47938, partial [Hypholoma sublateritium FD-334 SS-4]
MRFELLRLRLNIFVKLGGANPSIKVDRIPARNLRDVPYDTTSNTAFRVTLPRHFLTMDDNQTRLKDGQERYKKAMEFLSAPAREMDSKSNVEVYTEHQAKYTAAVAKKDEAYRHALERARREERDHPELSQKMYSDWVKENAPFWRSHIQEAYINWIKMGKKEEVEYWFATIGQDSDVSRN